MDGGFAASMGYTVVISGRMKCARLSVLDSSLPPPLGCCVCDGKSLESRAREKNDCCGGGGRFKMDFPGVGMVTADDEADEASIPAALRAVPAAEADI